MSGVERSVWIPAPPVEVWPAIADAERLGLWLDADIELELHAEGALVLADRHGTRRGIVISVDPCHHLEMWWESNAGGPGSVVRISLEPVDGGSLVTVTERRATMSAATRKPAHPVGFHPEPAGQVG